MCNTGKIEVEFDDVSHEYYAFWYTSKAIGSGKTKLDALRRLKEAMSFAVDTVIESRCEGLQNGNKEGSQIENQEEIKRKAREIVSLLPKKNCGGCGFGDCGQFALAVAQGKASPYDCHRGAGEIGKRISQIVNIDPPEIEKPYDLNIGFPSSEFYGRKNHGIGHGKGRRSGRVCETSHPSFHTKHHHG